MAAWWISRPAPDCTAERLPAIPDRKPSSDLYFLARQDQPCRAGHKKGMAMIRLVIGSILGGLAQFFVGFIFWGTPLTRLAFTIAGPGENAALQNALAQTLTPTGTGTYFIPWPDTPGGTTLLGKGPIATIHFTTGGSAAVDPGALLGGLIVSILTAFLIGLALHGIAARVGSLGERLRVALLISIAAAIYILIGQPLYNHYGWGYWIYLFVSQVAGFIAASFVIARWFLPRPSAIQ